MAHLLQDCGEIVDDLPTERRRQIAPDLPSLDWHKTSVNRSARLSGRETAKR